MDAFHSGRRAGQRTLRPVKALRLPRLEAAHSGKRPGQPGLLRASRNSRIRSEPARARLASTGWMTSTSCSTPARRRSPVEAAEQRRRKEPDMKRLRAAPPRAGKKRVVGQLRRPGRDRPARPRQVVFEYDPAFLRDPLWLSPSSCRPRASHRAPRPRFGRSWSLMTRADGWGLLLMDRFFQQRGSALAECRCWIGCVSRHPTMGRSPITTPSHGPAHRDSTCTDGSRVPAGGRGHAGEFCRSFCAPAAARRCATEVWSESPGSILGERDLPRRAELRQNSPRALDTCWTREHLVQSSLCAAGSMGRRW